MPTVKSKGSSTGQRYTPASEFDDATLAQKREYWRNKKREQRARRGTAPKKSLIKVAPATSSPLQIKNGSNHSVNMAASLQTGNATSASFVTLKNQKDQWVHTTKVNKVTCPNATKSEVKCVRPAVNTSSLLASQLKSSFPVPPLTNSSSAQPCVSMQIQSSPKTSQNTPIPVFIQPKTTANITVVSSPCGPKSTPQLGTKSALVTQQKPTNPSITPATTETEEEKAAKRRENWRIKKREQRARLAARLGKTKNRAQNIEVWTQKQNSGNTSSLHVQSCAIESRSLLNPVRMPQMAPPIVVVKKPAEPLRRNTSFFHLSGVTRPRSQTPRPNFIKQKYVKVKFPSLSYLYGGRSLPIIDPGDTPEQVIAKRREHWRIKKREQRAKLSTEVKSKLNERECLKRRMKRYHQILEDMRKARSQSIMHASETIGGFIKEDGTVTINIPQVTVNLNTPAQRQKQTANVDRASTKPQTSNFQMTAHRPVHVKVDVPLTGVNKPTRTHPIKPQMGTNKNSQGSHLTLTPASRNSNSGSASGGCVMKMAVSCKAPSLSAAYLDPSLTEEERMAKKREYWRVKKREQRAARAVRLRQSVSQARASAVLLKRKAQKHIASMPTSKRLPTQTGSNLNNNVAYANEVKQESDIMPAVDLNSNQAICPEIKPPVSPMPPPAQADLDPASSADSQATTLLAVASMKKLLEESLSSVAEYKSEPGIKMEEEKVEQNTKPDVSQFDVWQPIAADGTEGMDHFKEVVKQINEHVEFEQQNMPQITLSSTPDNSPISQPLSSFIDIPKIENPESSQRRTLRTKKAGHHQHCCALEPPKLHHPPIDMHSETQGPNDSRAMINKPPRVMETGLNSLQKKREYWKVMKRQQRARLKARQRTSNNMAALRNAQSSGSSLNKNAVVKPALLPKPSMSSGAAVTSMPTLLVVSPTAANAGPQGTLRVKPPVPSRDKDYSTRNENKNTNVNCLPPSLPTLKPPDNPLTRINIQPIESPCRNTTFKSITIPSAPSQNSKQNMGSKSSTNLVPPKPIPGESEEDFQRRKREYWRIKKKEQRARKAVEDKGNERKLCWTRTQPQTPPRARPQEKPQQDRNEWVYSPEESEHIMNNSIDSDGASFPFPNYTAPIEDDLYPDYESAPVEDGSGSEDFWRHHYLMDYDPLNQLLVCMVCGELQYVHSLEGVRGHIEEAHPDTLNLDPTDRQRILQAWDEQVFHRERFFTNQLQQHSTSMTEAHRN